ncbi:uncharacterized protein BDV17DRAFT_280890 [Aspergillus undulatus]|uniref:uncharacterized protein n=1 Tax=Aspergillus undulatus TaxID=1810928 RepID=UPI003CCD2B38
MQALNAKTLYGWDTLGTWRRAPVDLHGEEDKSKSSPRTIDPLFILEDHPVNERRLMKAIVVDAGITGITAGVLLPVKVPGLTLAVYERHSDIVYGTWHSNMYPGVRCGVPSHDVTTKYSVWDYIQLNREILSAKWSEESAKWIVTRSFSSGLPDIAGINDFKGNVIPTGSWDKTFDPTGKKVTLIENGASGLQILPELQKVASHVDHYTRNPTWVTDTLEDLKKTWESDRADYYLYRKGLETISGRVLRMSYSRSSCPTSRLIVVDLRPVRGTLRLWQRMTSSIYGHRLSNLPRQGPGQQIEKHSPVDAVICFPIINGQGRNLQDSWHAGSDPGLSDTYLGMLAAEYSSLFFLGGPNSGSGFAGTVPHTIETQVTYVPRILRNVSSQRIRAVTPSKSAILDFRACCESFRPPYHLKGERIVAVWPGSGAYVNYIRRDFRWEDFEYTYHNSQRDRFAYFGNG